MERKEWTLIAICCAKDKGLSPLQLQKALFLLGQELPQEVGKDYYKFIPYNYGPFDAAIYIDAESLAAIGLVSIESSSEKRWSTYLVTSSGMQCLEQLKPEIPHRAFQYLQNVVEWIQNLTFQELVRAIYEKYPQFRVNSVFRD